MADKLQGTWVFNKVTRDSTTTTFGSKVWNLNFLSNNEQFAALTIESNDFHGGAYNTSKTKAIMYWNPNGTLGISPMYSGFWQEDEAYRTIVIQSTYDEVEDAETLVTALTARATFTPSPDDVTPPEDDNTQPDDNPPPEDDDTTPGEDINILMESAKGVRLKTAGKRCKSDIVVTPAFDNEINLQDKTVTENGTYTADDGYDGLGTVSVNVPDREINLQDKTVTENGTVTADDGYDGLGTVSVNVPSEEPNIQPLTITENGTYTAGDGVNGYSPITVEVGASGGDSLEGVFDGSLTEVVLPTITKLNTYAFYQNTTITKVTAPNVTNVGGYAFQNCSKLVDIVLSENATTIYNSAFYSCSKLALTSLPKSLTTLGTNSFYGCSALALTSLPDGITSIPQYCFNNCRKLALTSLPNGLTLIDYSGFYNCSGITITEIPASVRTVGSYGFYGCTGITTLTFKGTPTSMYSSSFNGCTNLTTINVPWAEGAVANAPWGATNATINYNYTGG